MHRILRHMLMTLIAVLVTGSLAMPHVCLDNDIQHTQMELAKADKADNTSHNSDHGSKSDTHNCVAHHCCAAKLASVIPSITKVTFLAKATLPIIAIEHFSSFDPKGLDRPPKSFA